MMQSHIVEIDGRFVGAAVREDGLYRFVAVDVRLDDLDGRRWPTLLDLRQTVRAAALAATPLPRPARAMAAPNIPVAAD